MDRKERTPTLSELISNSINNAFYTKWTCIPAIIQSFNQEELTVECQPSIKGYLLQENGTEIEVDLPLLVDVPVVFSQGSNFIITTPIKKDDECIVIFSNRCIDKWWRDGGIQGQYERRLYDLSDGFAIVGVRSQPRKIEDVNSENIEIRNIDNKTKIYLSPENDIGYFNENYTLNIDKNGNVNINTKGNITAEIEGKTKIKGADIDLGTKTMEKMIRGETFMRFFNEHTHLGNAGAPVSPPQIPMTEAQLSQENIRNS